ncbi:MAG TPA: hypothetical protein VGF61_25565 [Candidatus Acidoferrum sp.]|jgi:hypothetical protein
MLDRLKSALVDSYVGAVALGYMLAQCVLHFANVFAYPIAGWITRDQYKDVVTHGTPMVGFTFRDGLPELVRFALLLAVWFVLLRWLYLTPLKQDALVSTPDSDQRS